jgi:hypothetical protein
LGVELPREPVAREARYGATAAVADVADVAGVGDVGDVAVDPSGRWTRRGGSPSCSPSRVTPGGA